MKKNYRRCISCRHVAPKSHFLRVVKDFSTQQIQIDLGMGRSAYICPKINCLIQAKQKKRLQKSLKVAIPEQIYHTLESRLAL